MVRCFMAIELPIKVKEKVWSENLVVGQFGEMSIVKKENLHITLRFLGHLTEEQVEQFKKAMDSIALKKFTIKLVGVGVFPSLSHAQVIWVGSSSGHDEIVELSKKLGNPDAEPHVTVARVKNLLKRKGLRDYVNKNEGKEFGEFVCDKITLFKSELGSDGAKYTKLYEKQLS